MTGMQSLLERERNRPFSEEEQRAQSSCDGESVLCPPPSSASNTVFHLLSHLLPLGEREAAQCFLLLTGLFSFCEVEEA